MIKISLFRFAARTTLVAVPPVIAQVDPKKDAETRQPNVFQSPEIRPLLDSNPDVKRRFDKWLRATTQEQRESKSADPPTA